MKNILLSLLLVLSFTILSGQVTKTINLTNAGNLSTELSSEELNSVTNLTITGNIDARDFKTMRDLMPVLADIDLSGVNILAYSGTEGTSTIGNESYTANSIPESAFENCSKLTSINLSNGVKILESFSFRFCVSLIDIVLPEGLTSIGMQTFFECKNLSTIYIPSSVISIDLGAISFCENLKTIKLGSPLPSNFILGQDVFWAIDKTTCSLYVPFGSKAFYQAADQWKDFQNIIEMEGPSGSKTVNLTTAGTLSTILSPSELASITSLTITGNIDARDFETMRDLMPVLAEINLSGATIQAYNPAGDNLNPANTIPPNAFYNKSALSGKQSLITCILPSTATTIGTSAFSNCLNLSAITIPLSVTEISSSAFAFCKKLESVNIPKNVTTIGNQAFYFCSASFIVDTDNPNYSSVDGVLFDKTKTTIIQCPKSKAGVYTIPSSVTNLGVNAFSGCSSLSEIIVPPLVKEMGYQTFSNCSGLVKINIPNSVHTIQPYAFEFCRKLSSITIPSSVTQIGGAAFRGCIELSSIYALKATPVDLSYSSDVFKDVDKAICILYVPSGSENLYATASQWSEFSNIQSIPVVSKTINLTSPGTLASLLTDTELASINNLTLTGTIDARDFKTMRDLMPALTELDLSAVAIAEYSGTEGTFGTNEFTYAADEIPRNAFYNKTGLTSMSIPLLAKTIGRSAFNNCDGLTQVSFGANSQLTTIGYLSFAYCDNLTDIQIPSGVTLIDYGAFRQCSALVTCNLPESVKTIGSAAFYQCYKLKNFSIPQAVETIGEFAFHSCKEILNFNIPASVIFVGRGTFIGATGNVLADENNPNYSSLNGVFYDKNKTQLIYCPPSKTGHFTIPVTVNTIAVDAFYNCSGITSFNFPEGLTTLEDWAFEECTGLKTLSLPESLISIGNQAFYNCSGLTSIIVNNPVPVDLSSKTDVFLGIDKSTCILNVPAGSESLYATAAQWNEFTQIVTSNHAPVANAGTDQTVNEGILVTLNGTASSDTDGNTLTYFWTAPNGIIISSATAGTPTFTAPEVSKDTEFIFSLKVNDGTVNSPEDLVIVVVKQVNKTPAANAGTDQTIEEGAAVNLDGSLSSDTDGDSLIYKWTAPDGVTLSSSSAQKPTFIAPEVTQDTQFTFTLIVNDGFEDSPADQVVVIVKQVNKTPVVDAGSDQIIEEGAVVILDGTLSSDADGDSIRYIWTAPDGITLSSSSAKEATFIAPDVTQDTQFSFSLIVNDGFEDSPADQVLITVKNVNKAPVANAGVDQIVKTGDKVVLNGTGSFDPDQDPLIYSWTSLNGITLSAASDPSPFFFAPVTKNETDLAFTLTVSDGISYSKTDTVIITVENKSPVISVNTFFGGTIASAEQVSYELYKETDGKFGKHSAKFSIENNTAIFNIEEGNWIILAIPVAPETYFIPTYYGNSVTWNEAEIITIQGDEVVDLKINCQKTEVEPAGEYSIEGFVYQDEGTKSCVILSGLTGNNPVPGTKVLLYREDETIPVRTTVTDNEGKYIFNSLNLADYKVIVDIPGFDQVDVWSIKLDSVSVSVININFTVITSLGVITDIPETELKTSIYPNPTTGKLYIKTENWPHNSKIEVFNSIGKLVYHSLLSGGSFILDLSNKPDGVYILNIRSNMKKETVKIVLRK